MAGRSLLLAWRVSADQEEPWRRFLQELSGTRREEYVGSRKRLGISVEHVWLVPGLARKPGAGGGMAFVYLEALDPEGALRQLADSETPFDSWYSRGMRKVFGFDLARSPRVAGGELLFAWREASGEGEHEPPKTHDPAPHFAKDGAPEGIRREGLLEARPIEEAIAGEAKPREAMNVTTPPVN